MKVNLQGQQSSQSSWQEGAPRKAAIVPDNRPEMIAQRKLLQTIRRSSIAGAGTAPTQMKQMLLVYRDSTTMRIDSWKLTLSQLQRLLEAEDLHDNSKVEVQQAIDAGEYLGAMPPPPNLSRPQSTGKQTGGQSHLMPPPEPVITNNSSMMPPPPSFSVPGTSHGRPGPMPVGNSTMSGGFPMPEAPPKMRLSTTQPDPNAAPPGLMTLYRGVHTEDQAYKIQAAGSAGGIAPDPNTGRPNERQVFDQVAMDEVAPWASASTPFKQQDVVEFTSNLQIAMNYGTRGGIIEVQIDGRYLTRGDIGAHGWTCLRSAPLTFIRHIKIEKPKDQDPSGQPPF